MNRNLFSAHTTSLSVKIFQRNLSHYANILVFKESLFILSNFFTKDFILLKFIIFTVFNQLTRKMKLLIILLFLNSANSLHVLCYFNPMHWNITNSVALSILSCDVGAVDYSDSQTHLTGHNGTYRNNKTRFDVQSFYFVYSYCGKMNVTRVPKGILGQFPNMIALSFNNCSVDHLDGDELNEYPLLELFTLQYSNIEIIPGNLFSKTPFMKYIYLGYNKIKRVGLGLLENLANLQMFGFHNNICISTAANGNFEKLINILRVNCSDGEVITTLSTSTSKIIETTEVITTSKATTSSGFYDSTSTTDSHQPPSCEILNLNNFVCELDKDVREIESKVEILNAESETLRTNSSQVLKQIEDLDAVNEEISKQISDLVDENSNLSNEVEVMKQQNQRSKTLLMEIDEKIKEMETALKNIG